jgi:RNA polymerase subunit RPABC4/transcription elongation factor Spt4
MIPLVRCVACGNDIAQAAKMCPRCGTSQRTRSGAGLPIVLLLIVGVVAIAAIVANYEETKKKEAVRIEPAIEVTAVQLQKDYDANEVAADEKYRGHILRVSGKVSSINKNIVDDPYVIMRTKDFGGVHAHFQSAGPLAELKKGEAISVRCRGDGFMVTSPMLRDCVLD